MLRQNFDTFYPVTIPAILPKAEPTAPPRKGRFAVILGRVRAWMARAAEQRQSAQYRRHLKALPDHLLHDIGMERGDVAGADLGPLIKNSTRLRF